jgi:hypothetical protein
MFGVCDGGGQGCEDGSTFAASFAMPSEAGEPTVDRAGAVRKAQTGPVLWRAAKETEVFDRINRMDGMPEQRG